MREKRTGPYIGVTGFMLQSEVIRALAMIPPRSTFHRLMVGVLMSSKTLDGRPNKWPGRYPKWGSVASIFVDDPRALNLVHYSTDDPATLYSQLAEITGLAGPNLDGFQLNITWPPISVLEDYSEAHPEKFIVLQVGQKAMVQMGESPEEIADMVSHYVPMVDAVLIDSSGGKGEPLNLEKCRAHLEELVSRGFPVGLGIAGGLGPDTLHLIDPLARQFLELSIDAEGRLRTPQPEDALDLNAVRHYIESAFDALEIVVS